MKRIVGVRFKRAGRMYYFNPGDLAILPTDGVIVETARGIEYGDVVLTPRDVPDEQVIAPLKDVLRIATEEDRETHERNTQLEDEAFSICQQKVTEHNLDMKLVDVEFTFNGSKITFFFTSEGRVDFRDLVKDLAYIFKTRIELRQIGVRDEAKMLGGLGSCGRPVCCNTFLSEFQPVSIRMAKEQKLSLSPTKISGLCGRLMCCLKYEQDAYESMRKLMPKTGRDVITVDGKGTVLENNAITERTKVRITLPDGTPDVREYHFSDVRKATATEDDAALQQELMQLAKERAVQVRHEEEEFRFVTGATPTPPDPAAQPQQEAAKSIQKRTGRRKSRNRNAAAGGEAPASPAHTKEPAPRRERERGAHAPGGTAAQPAAAGEAAQKKPGRNNRRGRNRRRKPSPNAPASTPPKKDNR